MKAFAEKYNKSIADMYSLESADGFPASSEIPKSGRIRRIQKFDFELSQDDVKAIAG